MERRLGWISCIVALAVGVWLSNWLLTQFDWPWIWIACLWAVLSFLAAYLSGSDLRRSAWLCVAAAIVGAGGAEAWLTAQADVGAGLSYEGDYTGSYYQPHENLGYGPMKGGRFSARAIAEGRVVYDTFYSIDAQGLRVTPLWPGSDPKASALFFGGSITFGEGVADEESMPYRVGELAGSNYRVYNFGFHGYGPHQMLAALEFGLVNQIVGEKVSHLVYQAIEPHIPRVRGLADWDPDGPRYEMNGRGEIEFAGPFSESRGRLMTELLPSLRRSLLYRKLFGSDKPRTECDYDVFVGVVARARELANRLYPDARFQVLIWDDPLVDGIILEDPAAVAAVYEPILSRFDKARIKYHRISDILPDFVEMRERYWIGEHDEHPNALAHDLIAKYVESKILSEEN